MEEPPPHAVAKRHTAISAIVFELLKNDSMLFPVNVL